MSELHREKESKVVWSFSNDQSNAFTMVNALLSMSPFLEGGITMNGWLFLLLLLLLICGLVIAGVIILQRSRTKASFRDDDRFWSGGYVYNNPDDRALFVPNRFDLGMTMNFGHPLARPIVIGCLLLLLLPPLVVAILRFLKP